MSIRHVPGTGFWNGASTLKQHFVLPKNGSKYYLKYTFLVFPVLGIFGLGTSLMSISQGQRAMHEYASQFKTLLGRLDSYDEKLILNQFIWGLQPELAQPVSLHYPKSIANAV